LSAKHFGRLRYELRSMLRKGNALIRMIWQTFIVGLFIFVATLCSCKSLATPDDLSRLKGLNETYAGKYRFIFEEDLYLTAETFDEQPMEKSEAIEIYKTFWFDGENERRETSFVYLNVFDKTGRFQFQLSWDREKKQFGYSKRPYY